MIDENQSKKNKKAKKNDTNNIKNTWYIQVFFITFFLSLIMSYVSTVGVSKLNLGFSIVILLLVIIIGIAFDILGIAVTVAHESKFHAKATKKVKGSKESLNLIKNSSIVSNICTDVVGDICGVLSGALSAMVAIKIASSFGVPSGIDFFIGAIVASLTVAGKAIGKDYAIENSTKIVHTMGVVFAKFNINFD